MSLTLFCTSSSVTSTAVQCSSSRGRRFVPFSVTHGCSYTHRNIVIKQHQYTSNAIHTYTQVYEATLISGTVILVSGFLSSILSMSSSRSLVMTGLGGKLHFCCSTCLHIAHFCWSGGKLKMNPANVASARLLTSLETPRLCSWSCCAERRRIRRRRDTVQGHKKKKLSNDAGLLPNMHFVPFFCSPFQRQSSRAWLPSPTRLTPGRQTHRGSSFLTLQTVFFLPWPGGSPFRWSPALLHLSSLGPWRPASPLCMTRGHQRPRTPCWRQNRRSWHGRRRPAAGWMVWCPCGWSCGSALGN